MHRGGGRYFGKLSRKDRVVLGIKDSMDEGSIQTEVLPTCLVYAMYCSPWNLESNIDGENRG